MVDIVQMYRCTVCKQLYRQSYEASVCEGLPVESFGLAVGQTIQFEEESQFGSRYSYGTATGVILRVVYSRCADNTHKQACLVRVNNRPYEAFVAMGDCGFGRQLVSQYDWKHPLGYASQLELEGN